MPIAKGDLTTNERITMNNEEIVKLLEFQMKSGITNILNDRYSVDKISHSTATSVEIYALLGEDKLLVWYKTNWISSNYEFNERGKKQGFQSNGPWVSEINEWLDLLYKERSERIEKNNKAKIAKKKSLEDANEVKLDKFRNHFSLNKPQQLTKE